VRLFGSSADGARQGTEIEREHARAAYHSIGLGGFEAAFTFLGFAAPTLIHF
jgi:hypothetical protein